MGWKKIELNGKTKYVVTASRRNKFGERKQCKRIANNLPEAKLIDRQLHADLEGWASGKPNLTWGEFIEFYFKYVRENQLKAKSTIVNEEHELHKHVYPKWKNIYLRDITGNDVRTLIEDAVGNKSPQTKKHLAKDIRGVFRLAEKLGYISENPAEYVSFKVERKLKRLPSKEQIQLLLQRAKEAHTDWYYVWHFLVCTGCRSGEAYSLRWKNVDLNGRLIFIVESWTRRGGFRAATKSGTHRTIPINDELLNVLTELKAKTYIDENSFVLPRIREWANSEGAKALKLFLSALGIPPVTLHCLRSVFITEMIRAGVPIPTIQACSGHTNLSNLLIYYSIVGTPVANATDKLSFMSSNESSVNG